MNQKVNINGPKSRCENSARCNRYAIYLRGFIYFDMKEVWKEVRGFELYYDISNYGNVKSKRSNKLLTPIIGKKKGYMQITLTVDGIMYKYYLHRLVALNFIPNPENKPQVNHKSGIKKDCSTANLEWCTGSENQHHAFDNGIRTDKGLNHYKNKLNSDQRYDVFNCRNRGMTYEKIAEIFNVSESHIWKIINR